MVDPIITFLNKVAYKFPKGYPDMNDPKDKEMLFEMITGITNEQQLSLFSDEELEDLTIKIKKGEEDPENLDKEEITALLNLNKDDKEFISLIKKKLKSQPKRKAFNKMAANANIDEKTVEGKDTPGELFSILTNNDDVDNFDEYINKGQLSLKSLKSEETRNIINDLKQTGISGDSITQLVNFGGYEGGRGVGKAEIAMALLLKDVKMMVGQKGDLDWDGNYLEVKGTSGRLGGRDQKLSGTANILKLLKKYPDISNSVRPDLFIPELIANGEDEDKILNLTKELATVMYPNANNIDKEIIKDILTENIPLRIAFQKIYVDNYVNAEGVDDFIFVDTSNRFGNYLVKSPEELIDYVSTNFTKFSGPVSIKNLSPTTFTNGI
jgi:hypothetical protein